MITTNLNLASYLSNGAQSGVVDPFQPITSSVANTAVQPVSSFDPAVNLDLSDAAKKILAASQQSKQTPTLTQPFSLSAQQTKQITDIIQSFKSAPLTNDTFTAISDALKKAGVGADKLAALDSLKSFNQTNNLASYLSAADGTGPAVPTQEQNASDMQNKQNQFLQSVYNYWQATTTSSPASATTSSTSSATSTATTPATTPTVG